MGSEHRKTMTVDGVSVEISKHADPDKGGKIPLPDDHAQDCTGDTCWCKRY